MASHFTVDASEAAALAAELRANLNAILPKVNDAVSAAGREAQRVAKDAAPRGPHTRRIRGRIRTKMRRTSSGSEVTVEVADPLGAVLEFGAKHNRGGLFMKAGFDAAEKKIEKDLSEALDGIL